MALWKKMEQVGGEPPLPRSSHTLTVVGNKAYCIGGENQPRIPISSTVHIFDLSTGQWSAVEAAKGPTPRVGHTAVACGPAGSEKIYIFGGRNGIALGDGASAELLCFNTGRQEWQDVQIEGIGPDARSYHAMAASGDTLYVFGGCGEGKKGRLNDLHSYNCPSGTWTQLPTCDEIIGRGGAGLVATPEAVYVIAGFSGAERQDVWRHDLKTGSWAEVVPLDAAKKLPPRSVFGATAVANLLMVTGGEVDPAPAELGHAGAGHFSSDTFILDTTRLSDGWKKLDVEGEVPTPRGWFASSGISGQNSSGSILIHGGNSLSNERLGDMFMLTMA